MLACAVLVLGGAATYYATGRIVGMLLGTVVIGAWAVSIVVRRCPPSSALLLPILLCVAIMGITCAMSARPMLSLDYLLYAILAAGLYLALVDLLRVDTIRSRLLIAVPMLCVTVCVIYLLLAAWDWVTWWVELGWVAAPPLRPRNEGLAYSNPSAVMAVATLLGISALSAIPGNARRHLRWAIAALVSGVIFVSGSRGGWIGIGLMAIAITGFWIIARGGISWPPAGRRLHRRGGAVLVVVAATLLLAFSSSLAMRMGSSGGDLRVAYAKSAMREFEDSPIIGAGPGMWVVERLRYYDAADRDRYVPHAHNVIAQTLAETGIVGAVAGLALMFAIVRMTYIACRSEDPERRRWSLAAVAAVAYLAGHQLADMYMNAPGVLLAAAFPVAMVDATHPSSATRRLAMVVVAVMTVALTIGLPVTLRAETNAATAEAIVRAVDAGREDTEGSMSRIASDEPWVGSYVLSDALLAARRGDLDHAERALRSVALGDDLPAAWLDLAAIETMTRRPAEARVSLGHASRLGLQHPAVAVGIGQLRLQLGQRAEAIEAYAAAIVAAPSLAGDPALRRGAIGPIRDAIIERALELAPDDAWLILLEAGEIEPARVSASRLSDPQRSLAADMIDAVATAGKLDSLTERYELDPSDPVLAQHVIRAAVLAGEPERAQSIRNALDRVDQFAQSYGRTVRIVPYGEAAGRPIGDDSSAYYGLFHYRRPTLQDQLVPGLDRVVLVPDESTATDRAR